MYLAASPAPHHPPGRAPIHQLTDDEFIEQLRRLQGTPEAVFDSRELIEFLLPGLRADFQVCDTYLCAPEPPLTCPLCVFGGTDDGEVDAHQLAQWRELTVGPFRLQMLPGTHFFVLSERQQLLAEIAAHLAGLV
jgi:medium-chain acyl-[acyl-carrier-protein] hydrolase